MGLGLKITKTIVESLGGSIHVASEINKGSIFTFTIQLDNQPSLIVYPLSNQEHDLLEVFDENEADSLPTSHSIKNLSKYLSETTNKFINREQHLLLN